MIYVPTLSHSLIFSLHSPLLYLFSQTHSWPKIPTIVSILRRHQLKAKVVETVTDSVNAAVGFMEAVFNSPLEFERFIRRNLFDLHINPSTFYSFFPYFFFSLPILSNSFLAKNLCYSFVLHRHQHRSRSRRDRHRRRHRGCRRLYKSRLLLSNQPPERAHALVPNPTRSANRI